MGIYRKSTGTLPTNYVRKTSRQTEHRRQVVNSPDSYSEASGLKTRPADRVS